MTAEHLFARAERAISERHLPTDERLSAMDNLLKRADLAISDSRRIRSEVHYNITEARVSLARVRWLLQCAHAENDKALMAANDAWHLGDAPKDGQPLLADLRVGQFGQGTGAKP